jgi:hypothetical protein
MGFMSSTRLPEFVANVSSILRDMDQTLPYGIRGIVKHLEETGRVIRGNNQDEVAVISQLCSQLRDANIPAKANPSIVPDIDVAYGGPDRIKVEAKVYYTAFFQNADLAYRNPKLAYGSQTWRARIQTLVEDCATKLLPQCQASDSECGGLLVGFELEPCPGTIFSKNPRHAEIVNLMRAEVTRALPGTLIHRLSPENGWRRSVDSCTSFSFSTHAWYWQIPIGVAITQQLQLVEG